MSFMFLCSHIACSQLSACNPACIEVVSVSAAFVTRLSTVVPPMSIFDAYLWLVYSGLGVGKLLDRGVGQGSRRQ